jgi:hypothetical protein
MERKVHGIFSQETYGHNKSIPLSDHVEQTVVFFCRA